MSRDKSRPSRLNDNLREKHGYTYGARSGFERFRTADLFLAMADVHTDKDGSLEGPGPAPPLNLGPIKDLAVEDVMGPAPKVD